MFGLGCWQVGWTADLWEREREAWLLAREKLGCLPAASSTADQPRVSLSLSLPKRYVVQPACLLRMQPGEWSSLPVIADMTDPGFLYIIIMNWLAFITILKIIHCDDLTYTYTMKEKTNTYRVVQNFKTISQFYFSSLQHNYHYYSYFKEEEMELLKLSELANGWSGESCIWIIPRHLELFVIHTWEETWLASNFGFIIYEQHDVRHII